MKTGNSLSWMGGVAICVGLGVYFAVSGNWAALGMAILCVVSQTGWWLSDNLADDCISLLKEISRRLDLGEAGYDD